MKNLLRKFPYWYLLVIPVLLFALGVFSNQLVLVANHGKFPVMLNEVMRETFCRPSLHAPANACGNGGQFIDPVHSVMGPSSHLKVLADIFPLGSAIYSVGDGMIFLGDWLMSYTPIMWLALILRKLIMRD